MKKAISRTTSSISGKSIFVLLGGILCFGGAGAQTVPRLIDPAAQNPNASLPKGYAASVASDVPAAAVAQAVPGGGFTLTDVQVQGARTIDPARLAATWQPMRGKAVTREDLAALGNTIAQLYATSGYELVSVIVPAQTFAGGKVTIQVIEGRIGAVTIEGNTDGADLTLLKSYAARILADSPLRRDTLERYILLMNDIPGLKVGSRFEAIGGAPGAVRLVLTILQKQYEWGFQVNNLGTRALGNTQATLVGAVDGLFRQGDQTQLTVGFPAEANKFQYVGLTHRQPIGTDGAALQIGAGYIHTDPGGVALMGDAETVNASFTYPWIRTVHESLILGASADMLNSNSALLGQALADERTRSLRVSAVYGRDDAWRGTTVASVSLNQGIDVLGARRGSLAFGGPTYTKLSLLLTREQQLPWDLVARGKLEAQYAADHLPNSEQLLLGGPYFGRAFDTAYLSGDRGVATSLELAHATPASWTPDFMAGSELFGFVDWGQATTVATKFQLPYAHIASGGAGVRLKFLRKVTLELAGAAVINQPPQFARLDSPRFIFGFSRQF
jgi:hemolysin activation/secretion protein